MQIGDFELTILDAAGRSRPETSEGHVPMQHGEQYQIGLRNRTGRPCNLSVLVDGVSVGDFQISPWQFAMLERPRNDHGRFTFFASETSEAMAVGDASVSSADKGIVQVTFTPEIEQPKLNARPKDVMLRSCGGASAATAGGKDVTYSSAGLDFGAGVTGQTGHSGQHFGVARNIVEDLTRRTTITLRLVHQRGSVPSTPRPLPGRVAANAVPRPVA